MGFICGHCGQPTLPGIKPVRRVIATRPATYPMRPAAHRINRHTRRDDPGGRGTEIAKEILVGPCCAARYLKN